MKFLKSRNGALISLLVALLVVSCFWIVKSEIRAASLQSRLDEHHKQLQVNSDVLKGLVMFERGTSNAKIQLTEDIAFLSSKLASIKLKNNKVEIETPGDIQIGNGNDIKFGYDKKAGQLYMINKDSRMYIGKMVESDGSLDYGSLFKTKSGVEFDVRDKGIAAFVPSDMGDYSLKMSRLKKYVELKKDNSIIRFEGDDISIEADGDINITSKNGKVNINGKR